MEYLELFAPKDDLFEALRQHPKKTVKSRAEKILLQLNIFEPGQHAAADTAVGLHAHQTCVSRERSDDSAPRQIQTASPRSHADLDVAEQHERGDTGPRPSLSPSSSTVSAFSFLNRPPPTTFDQTSPASSPSRSSSQFSFLNETNAGAAADNTTSDNDMCRQSAHDQLRMPLEVSVTYLYTTIVHDGPSVFI
jgi:hypothetical protein